MRFRFGSIFTLGEIRNKSTRDKFMGLKKIGIFFAKKKRQKYLLKYSN